jgi:FkbM family methyltransferase
MEEELSQAFDRIGGNLYKTATRVTRAAQFNQSVWGRKVLARLNILGEKIGRSLLFRGRPVKVDGHLMYVAGRSAPSISFSTELLAERYEQEITKVLNDEVLPGIAVLDIGAHVGCHTLLAARLVGPGGKVFAFEPSPDNFALLQKNVTLNGYDNVVLIQKAVADRSGTVTFYLSPEGNDRNSIYEDSRTPQLGTSLEVSSVSIDDFLEQQGWPQIHLIKVDVEGAEQLVLKGMSKLLERTRDLVLIIEFAPACIRNSGFPPESFLAALASNGFSVNVLQGVDAAKPISPEMFLSFAKEVELQGMKNLLCYRRNLGTDKALHG